MEFEKALFRVYDRTLETVRLDQPLVMSRRAACLERHVRPEKVCSCLQNCLLSVTMALLVMLLLLHTAFVGEGRCLKHSLHIKQQLMEGITADGNNANRTADDPPLMRKDDILQIRLSDRPEREEANRSALNFAPEYKFVRDPPLLYVSNAFIQRHDVRLVNLTLSPSCITRGAPVHRWILDALVGWDTVVVNQVMHGVRAGGLLQNMQTHEVWGWSSTLIPPEGGRSFGDALGSKLSTLAKSFLSFFFLSTVTALIVRMLISSGVIIMFPIFFCLRRLGYELRPCVTRALVPGHRSPLSHLSLLPSRARVARVALIARA
jgi:hypothetical protein